MSNDTIPDIFTDEGPWQWGVDWGSGEDSGSFVMVGQPFYDDTDYSRDCIWLGIDREPYIRDEHTMPYTENEIDDIFSYHKPEGNQPERYEAIRSKAREFAKLIVANTTSSPEQTLAIRKLEEVVMRTNQCIALRG